LRKSQLIPYVGVEGQLSVFAFSRITASSRIGVCTFQGGVNAAGMQYAYAGMAQDL
jgi:hypothetical protein